jgi:hypothetical protein
MTFRPEWILNIFMDLVESGKKLTTEETLNLCIGIRHVTHSLQNDQSWQLLRQLISCIGDLLERSKKLSVRACCFVTLEHVFYQADFSSVVHDVSGLQEYQLATMVDVSYKFNKKLSFDLYR